MMIILVAHLGVATDDIRFDSRRTTFFAITQRLGAHPHLSCDVRRGLFEDTIRAAFIIYTLMTMFCSSDFHEIWKICRRKCENRR